MDDDEYALICSLDAYPLDAYPLDLLPASERASTATAASSTVSTVDTASDMNAILTNATNTSASNITQRHVQLSVSEETFAVIKRQIEHRRLRATLRLHRQDKTLKRYLARWGDLRDSEASVNFSPCMLARVLLDAKFGWSKTAISNVFKDALALDASRLGTGVSTDAMDVGAAGSSASSDDSGPTNWRGLDAIAHARLLREVRECIDHDTLCSPLADRVRHSVGVEFEYLLLETLRNRRLVFESEDALRERGLAKTPDVRLLLPIGVRDARNALRIVHWIDSKAMFGDRHTHETENAGQLQGYVNRYGPGMVIYWFGHVADLSADDSDVFITHAFPHAIELPGGLDLLDDDTIDNSSGDFSSSSSRHDGGGSHDDPLQEGSMLALTPQHVTTTFDRDWTPVSTCVFEN